MVRVWDLNIGESLLCIIVPIVFLSRTFHSPGEPLGERERSIKHIIVSPSDSANSSSVLLITMKLL